MDIPVESHIKPYSAANPPTNRAPICSYLCLHSLSRPPPQICGRCAAPARTGRRRTIVPSRIPPSPRCGTTTSIMKRRRTKTTMKMRMCRCASHGREPATTDHRAQWSWCRCRLAWSRGRRNCGAGPPPSRPPSRCRLAEPSTRLRRWLPPQPRPWLHPGLEGPWSKEKPASPALLLGKVLAPPEPAAKVDAGTMGQGTAPLSTTRTPALDAPASSTPPATTQEPEMTAPEVTPPCTTWPPPGDQA